MCIGFISASLLPAAAAAEARLVRLNQNCKVAVAQSCGLITTSDTFHITPSPLFDSSYRI